MYTTIICSLSLPLRLDHQRHRLTVVCLTTRNGKLHAILLQRRAAIDWITNQEDLVQLALDTAHERPKVASLSIDSKHHRLVLDLNLCERDQLRALGQLVPRREAQTRCAGGGEHVRVVVQKAVG